MKKYHFSESRTELERRVKQHFRLVLKAGEKANQKRQLKLKF